MASPVSGPNQGNAEQNLVAQIRRIVQQELANAARGGIGLHLDGATGNLIIDNGDIRSGNYVAGSAGWDLAPSGSAELGQTTVRGGKIQSGNYVAGTSGWGLDGAGNAEFNSLTLRGGIIGNDALTNPVSVGYASNTQSNFAIGTTQGTFATAILTVPSGFTSAVIWSWAGAYVWNTATAATYVYLESGPAGADPGLPWAVGANGAGVTATMDGVILRSSLTGGATVSISALMQAAAAIPANASTQAWTRVMALWFR